MDQYGNNQCVTSQKGLSSFSMNQCEHKKNRHGNLCVKDIHAWIPIIITTFSPTLTEGRRCSKPMLERYIEIFKNLPDSNKEDDDRLENYCVGGIA